MAIYCNMRAVDAYNFLAGNHSMRIEANLVNTDVGGELQQETILPSAVFGPNATGLQVADAIVDAMVAAADVAFGWTLPRTNCLVFSFARGLPL